MGENDISFWEQCLEHFLCIENPLKDREDILLRSRYDNIELLVKCIPNNELYDQFACHLAYMVDLLRERNISKLNNFAYSESSKIVIKQINDDFKRNQCYNLGLHGLIDNIGNCGSIEDYIHPKIEIIPVNELRNDFRILAECKVELPFYVDRVCIIQDKIRVYLYTNTIFYDAFYYFAIKNNLMIELFE